MQSVDVMHRRRGRVATPQLVREYAVVAEPEVLAMLSLVGLAEAQGRLVVLRELEQVVGVALVDPRGATAELLALVVAPGRRFRGLGRQLLAEAAWLARTLGCRRLRVRVPTEEEGAVAFFTALGFERLAVALDLLL